jgi:hypothetical protein
MLKWKSSRNCNFCEGKSIKEVILFKAKLVEERKININAKRNCRKIMRLWWFGFGLLLWMLLMLNHSVVPPYKYHCQSLFAQLVHFSAQSFHRHCYPWIYLVSSLKKSAITKIKREVNNGNWEVSWSWLLFMLLNFQLGLSFKKWNQHNAYHIEIWGTTVKVYEFSIQ